MSFFSNLKTIYTPALQGVSAAVSNSILKKSAVQKIPVMDKSGFSFSSVIESLKQKTLAEIKRLPKNIENGNVVLGIKKIASVGLIKNSGFNSAAASASPQPLTSDSKTVKNVIPSLSGLLILLAVLGFLYLRKNK